MRVGRMRARSLWQRLQMVRGMTDRSVMNMWVIHWIPACAGMTEGGLKERGRNINWGAPPDPRQEASCTSLGLPRCARNDRLAIYHPPAKGGALGWSGCSNLPILCSSEIMRGQRLPDLADEVSRCCGGLLTALHNIQDSAAYDHPISERGCATCLLRGGYAEADAKRL